jgi:alpha-L-arabinofuranosidase
MELKLKRSEFIELFGAIRGLSQMSTQAAFKIAKNFNVLSPIAKEHDETLENLRKMYATRLSEATAEEVEYAFEEDGRTMLIEGQNLVKLEADYKKYLDEEIEVKDLKVISQDELKVRISKPGTRTELVSPDFPAAFITPLLQHGLITYAE